MSDEPSMDALRAAVNEWCDSVGHAGWHAEASSKLRVLRMKKHTWIGDEENQMRFRIDRMLAGRAPE